MLRLTYMVGFGLVAAAGLCLAMPQIAMAQDWSDLPSARAQAAQQRQQEFVQQQEMQQQQQRMQQQQEGAQSAAPSSPPPLPSMKQLVNQAFVPFDPKRETPQQYMARMKVVENQMRQVTAADEQARRDPPITHLPPGTVLPGMSSYEIQKPGDNFSANPYDRGFFGGITPQQAAAGMQIPLLSPNKQNVGPSWAKQKGPDFEYVDGVKHYGKQDSMGFF